MTDRKNIEISTDPEVSERNKEQVLIRINYLKQQLANEGHLDGYVITDFKEELKWLEDQLEKLDASKTS